MKVLRINAKDTRLIRQKVLRPGRPLADCIFEGDEDDQTFHLGAFRESKLVSIASFYFEKHPDIDEPYQYRLRGMATLPEFQRLGLSSALLKTGFPIVKQNFCHLVWCNARENAVGFYASIGFKSVGELFTIPDVGAHMLMIYDLPQKI